MKEVKAVAKNVRLTPRKARVVADAVRGMNAVQAMNVLQYTPKKAAHHVRKVIASAVANAVHNENMNPENLIISQAFVGDGIVMKRFLPQAKGRVRQILKRNSHITIYVTDGSAESKPAKQTKTAAAKKEDKVVEKAESKKPTKKAEPKKAEAKKPAAKKKTTKKTETKSTKKADK